MFDGAQPVLIALGLLAAPYGLAAVPDLRPLVLQSPAVGVAGPWDRMLFQSRWATLAQQAAHCQDDSLMCRLEGIGPRAAESLVWVPVTRSVTVEELATQLSINESRLAQLNQLNEGHRFAPGDWVALPESSLTTPVQLSFLDLAQRRSAPPSSPGRQLPFASPGVARLGNTSVVPAVASVPSAIPHNARSLPDVEQWLASIPQSSQEKTWVPVTRPVTVEELSSQLTIDESRLAQLNKVDEDHRFDRGEWLALPASAVDSLSQITSIEGTERRATPPVPQDRQPPLTRTGVVRFGDTLAAIASRYGMTIAELLRLNPGLETARLVVGTQIRLAQAGALPALPPILGLKPVDSWPEQPQISVARAAQPGQGVVEPRRLNSAFDGLVSEGVLSPAERMRVHRALYEPISPSRRSACSSGALSSHECRGVNSGSILRSSFRTEDPSFAGSSHLTLPQSSRQALLQRIRESREGVPRTFGSCTYLWDGWRLSSNGVRMTTYGCKDSGVARYTVGVSCTKLKVNQFKPKAPSSGQPGRWAWSEWRNPAAGGEEEMVAALCSNLQDSL